MRNVRAHKAGPHLEIATVEHLHRLGAEGRHDARRDLGPYALEHAAGEELVPGTPADQQAHQRIHRRKC